MYVCMSVCLYVCLYVCMYILLSREPNLHMQSLLQGGTCDQTCWLAAAGKIFLSSGLAIDC